MLNLETRIHLQEVDTLVSIIEDEFNRACIPITCLTCEPARHGTHALTQAVIDSGRGSLLNDLLIPPLDGTFPLPQVNYITVMVGNDLYLDMTDSLNIALHKEVIRSKGLSRLVLAGLHGGVQLFPALHNPYPSSSSGARRPDHQRISNLFCNRYGLRQCGDASLMSRLNGYAQLYGKRLCGYFITQLCDD